MNDPGSESDSTDSADTPDTGRLPAISALVVDVAAATQSHAQQDALSDFIWHMLDKDYQIYLCSSTTREDGEDALAGESFAHPQLTWLHGRMPPGAQLMTRHPALTAATTLWISDDERVQRWVRERGLAFVSVGHKTASFAADFQLAGWGELGALLDPTAQAVRQVAEAIVELRRTRPQGPIIVGIGGPPESGYERFAVELKRELEADSAPLVELLDLSSLLAGAPAEGVVGENPAHSFPATIGEVWWLEYVLQPLAKGGEVYVEKAPQSVPVDFRSHFPLYVHADAVVLMLGETVFQKTLRETMHLAVLVEVTPEETARRLYEIPEGEEFDESFTKQFLEHDGRRYEEYLAQHQVVAEADIRISANSPRKFEVLPLAVVAN